MKIGIFFGSTTGNTERIADILSDYFHENCQVNYIENFNQSHINKYDLLIFGISTWNVGELESTWEDFFPSLENFDFTGQLVAIYGLGDQANYPDTFQDAMGILYNKLQQKNALIIGHWETEGYIFNESLGKVNDKFVGLALDEDNQAEKTEERIIKWIDQLKDEISKKEVEINQIY